MIDVSGLVYEYPGLRALDDVGFRIERGTITALVGPNGAGKTTLLRCLAGMERPFAGAIRVNGVDVVDEPRASHRHVGYLSDFFGLYGELSVRQCLGYVAAANGLDVHARDRAIEEVANELGLVDRLAQRAGELSRGLRQRVAIAQAIIHAPAVVLLDEPASGLDPEARYALGELFVALRQRGLTLLVSSHILAELEAYSTHMLILQGGRVVDHRALAGAATAVAQTRLEIRALEGPAALRAALASRTDVGAVDEHEGAVRCTCSENATVHAELLAHLVRSGLRVTSFAPAVEDLQQAYLQSLTRAGHAREP